MAEALDRRRFLQAAAAVGVAGTAAVLDPLRFAAAQTGEETRVITGRFEPGVPDWVYLPVEVPGGVRELAVRYSYDRPAPPPGVPGNALDIGIFDEQGYELGNRRGFEVVGRVRDSFAIAVGGDPRTYRPSDAACT